MKLPLVGVLNYKVSNTLTPVWIITLQGRWNEHRYVAGNLDIKNQSFGVTARPVVAGPSVGVEGNGAFIGMPTFSDFIGIGVFSHVFNYVLISLDQNHNKVGSNMKHPATRMFWTKRAFFFETHTSYHITIIVCTDKNRKNVRTGRRGLWTQKKHVCTIKLQWSCGFYWCNSTCTNGHAAQWSAQQPPRQTCISYEAKASIPYYINLSIFNCTQIF